MTKSEIVRKHQLGFDIGSWFWKKTMLSMDEYAKQQVIAYEIWLEAELNNDSSFNYNKTPEQLYDLFIQQNPE